VLFGTGIVCVRVMIAGFRHKGDPAAVWQIAGAALYLVSVLILAGYHVPHNDQLMKAGPNAAGASATGSHFCTAWMAWNHARTLATALSSSPASPDSGAEHSRRRPRGPSTITSALDHHQNQPGHSGYGMSITSVVAKTMPARAAKLMAVKSCSPTRSPSRTTCLSRASTCCATACGRRDGRPPVRHRAARAAARRHRPDRVRAAP
jgi:hypothetical protein